MRSTLPAPPEDRRPSIDTDGSTPRGPLFAGRYTILGLLGVGGMGSVYRAYDNELEETVALKAIARELSSTPGMIERFRREVKLARRVTHRNIARVFDIGEHAGDRFLTMELVEGESLGARFRREGPLGERDLVSIFLQICEGLDAAHAARIIHRDLKPDNVLLERDTGRVVVTDFGIASARMLAGDLGKTMNIVVGTPDYMAPEQIEGKRDIDGRADIYALGVMMFELATGRAPWTGTTALATLSARLVSEPPDPRSSASVGDGVAAIIRRCMARHAEARFGDVQEIIAALRAVSFAQSAPRPTGAVRIDPRAAREKTVAVVVKTSGTDEMARATAEGFADLLERGLRGAPTLRVVPRDASFIVGVSIALEDDHVAMRVSVVSAQAGVSVLESHHRVPRGALFDVAARLATLIAKKLFVGPIPTLPSGPTDRELVDLWLRARFEGKSGSPGARDRAVAAFEKGIALAPDDVWINAGYAALLVERFRLDETAGSDLVEARAMADLALAKSDVLGEAWLARATCSMELGYPTAAVADLERAARLMPTHAPLHAARGRLLLDAAEVERAAHHFEEAIAIEPHVDTHRVDRAMALALDGDANGASAVIDEALAIQPRSPTAWLAAVRLALWSTNVSLAKELSRAVERLTFERHDRVHVVLAAMIDGDSAGVDCFAEIALAAEDAPRRAAEARRLEAEIALFLGDLPRAADAIDAAVATTGFCDIAWLTRCPLLAPLRAAPRFVDLLEQVRGRAYAVRSRLDATTREKP